MYMNIIGSALLNPENGWDRVDIEALDSETDSDGAITIKGRISGTTRLRIIGTVFQDGLQNLYTTNGVVKINGVKQAVYTNVGTGIDTIHMAVLAEVDGINIDSEAIEITTTDTLKMDICYIDVESGGVVVKYSTYRPSYKGKIVDAPLDGWNRVDSDSKMFKYTNMSKA